MPKLVLPERSLIERIMNSVGVKSSNNTIELEERLTNEHMMDEIKFVSSECDKRVKNMEQYKRTIELANNKVRGDLQVIAHKLNRNHPPTMDIEKGKQIILQYNKEFKTMGKELSKCLKEYEAFVPKLEKLIQSNTIYVNRGQPVKSHKFVISESRKKMDNYLSELSSMEEYYDKLKAKSKEEEIKINSKKRKKVEPGKHPSGPFFSHDKYKDKNPYTGSKRTQVEPEPKVSSEPKTKKHKSTSREMKTMIDLSKKYASLSKCKILTSTSTMKEIKSVRDRIANKIHPDKHNIKRSKASKIKDKKQREIMLKKVESTIKEWDKDLKKLLESYDTLSGGRAGSGFKKSKRKSNKKSKRKSKKSKKRSNKKSKKKRKN